MNIVSGIRDQVRLYWKNNAWIIETPFHLQENEIERVINYSLPMQIKRLNALPVDKRHDFESALVLLKNRVIHQKIVNGKNPELNIDMSNMILAGGNNG
jgi:hypothetical protein